MNFSQALEELKKGKKVCRQGWNSKGVFLYLVEGTIIDFDKLRGNCAKYVTKDSTQLDAACINSHIDMRIANGSIVIGWVPSQTDLLAEDWEVIA